MENIYEEALKIELSENHISFEFQKEIKIKYMGTDIGTHRLDFIVENNIILELKAVKERADIHFARFRSYLSQWHKSWNIAQFCKTYFRNQKNR